MLQQKKEAEEAADIAVAIDPTDAAAYFNRAQFSFSEHDIKSATTYVKKAIELEPSYADAYMLLGEIAVAQGQFRQALTEYDKAIKLVADLKESFYLQNATGDACFDHEILYRKKLEASYRNRQATIAGLIGDLSLAARYLGRSKQLDSANPFTFYLSSQLAAVRQQNSLALQEIDHAIELNPKIPENYVQKGDVLLKSQGWAASIKAYDVALKLNPTSLNYIKEKCNTLTAGDAYGCYSDLIARFPQNPDLYIRRTTAESDDNALADFTRALQLQEQGETYFNRSTTYIQRNDWRRALADVNRAVELNFKYQFVYWQRSYIKRQLGDWKGAAEDIKEGMRIREDRLLQRNGYFILAEIAVQTENLNEAIENLDLAIKYDKEFATGYELKADILARQRRFEDAARNYSKALAHLAKSQSLDIQSLATVPIPLKRKSLSEKLKSVRAAESEKQINKPQHVSAD
jgi:tetratricopeptide (TPR) repeat protein